MCLISREARVTSITEMDRSDATRGYISLTAGIIYVTVDYDATAGKCKHNPGLTRGPP
jgi:hypothetical protein